MHLSRLLSGFHPPIIEKAGLLHVFKCSIFAMDCGLNNQLIIKFCIVYPIVVALLCLCNFDIIAQKKVYKIHYQGLKKTNPSYIEKFIVSDDKDSLDINIITKDVQSLRNLNLFLDIDYQIKDTLDGIAVNFQFKEALSLLPILNFGGIKNNFWFQLGAIELNWRGQGLTLGGYYRYDRRHSFQVFQQTPYLGSSKWGYELNILKLSQQEPIYLNEKVVDYNYDNITLEILPGFTFSQNHKIQMGIAYLNEKYEAQGDPGEFTAKTQKNKFILKFVHSLKKIDQYYSFKNGFSNQIFIESVITTHSDQLFWKVNNETKYFKRVGQGGNFASRLRMGIATNNGSPFAPFVLDSYINIRGVGNRVSRGSGELVLNLEYRQRLWDKKAGTIQSVIFSDTGTWRNIGGSLSTLFDGSNIKSYWGLGIRLFSKRIYNLTVRVDYAVNLRLKNEKGLVIGIGQYF